MTPIRCQHPVRRVISTLVTLAAALLAISTAAPAAFALPQPPKAGAGGIPASVRTVVVGGTPGWQIALIAIAAAITAAAVAVIIDRARAARRSQLVPSP